MIYYHYCSVENFQNIINSKVFWLSDLTESNDKEEMIRSFDHVWNGVKDRLANHVNEIENLDEQIKILDKQYQIEKQVDKPFGCCFCTTGDALEQWKEYGDRTQGLSLGFDFDLIKNLELKSPHPNTNIHNALGYGQVIYHNVDFEIAMYHGCLQAFLEHGNHAWLMSIRPTFKHYSAFVKNPTFYSESEFRIVYYPSDSHDYNKNPYGLTGIFDNPFPHYTLPWVDENGRTSLKNIYIGCNCNLSEEDVRQYLKNAQITDPVDIFQSKCSYRIR